jgi:hypothetical protein
VRVDERRRVRAIIVVDGRVIGTVAPFPVDSPFWPDVEPVVAHLDDLLGVPTAVLRLVRVVGGESPRGGEVTYLVEAAATPSRGYQPGLLAGGDPLAPSPLRAPWAEPGGPAAIVTWSDAVLAGYGRPRTGPPVQVKSWNLSSLYRLPTASGPAWAKVTGAWQASEPRAIALAGGRDPSLVPTVLAADAGRILLDHVPGQDCWDADEATVLATVPRWVAVQAALVGDPGLAELRDGRLVTLPERANRLLARDDVRADLTSAALDAVAELVEGLPALLAAIDAAGLPDTLVHGDFHPGNWRSDGGPAVIIDWADSYLGNPALDVLRLRDWLPGDRWAAGVREWAAAWRAAVPGSDPAAAVPLLDPVERLQAACGYRRFLDNIEPDEWPYHCTDPADMLRLAGTAFHALTTTTPL